MVCPFTPVDPVERSLSITSQLTLVTYNVLRLGRLLVYCWKLHLFMEIYKGIIILGNGELRCVTPLS